MSVTISDDAARFLHQLIDLARFNGADAKLQAAMVQKELEQGLANPTVDASHSGSAHHNTSS